MKKIIFLVLMVPQILTAQNEFSYNKERTSGLPVYSMDSFLFYNDDKTAKVNTFLKIRNDALQYVFENGVYSSSFEITYTVYNSEDEVIKNESKKDQHNTKSFNATQLNDAFHFYTFQFFPADGTYKIKTQIRDLNTNKYFDQTNEVKVISFEKQAIVLSDLMIIETLKDSTRRNNIIPIIDDIVTNIEKGFSIYFELYPQNLKFNDVRFEIYAEDEAEREPVKPIYIGSVDYKLDKRETQQIFHRFDTDKIHSGRYTLIIKAKTPTDSLLVEKRKTYSFDWNLKPTSPKDIEIAIDQLIYFAKTPQFEKMKSAKTDSERKQLFDEFWKPWDPNPDTEYNEMMQEYYKRVRIANKLYRAFMKPGWKTDRGMVFIMYGLPDYVNSVLSASDSKPYEVWYYYDIHKKYIFISENSDEDYRLVNSLNGESSELR